MCARYGTAAEFNLLEKTYKTSLPRVVTLPQQIVYPHSLAPVIVMDSETLGLRLMNFSLVPHWCKTRKPKFATHNARLEEVLNKPSWKVPFQRRHCLVPIQYFIESVYIGPFAGHNIRIEAGDHRLLSAAGIWDTWLDKSNGQLLESFAIITTNPPKDILAAGHDRCPLFLKPDSFVYWLKPGMSDKENINFLMDSKESIEFSFKEKEQIKNFDPQLSLFEEED